MTMEQEGIEQKIKMRIGIKNGIKRRFGACLCGLWDIIPLPLFGFISTCHALTGAFLFARKPLFYAGFVPFLVLADIVLCLIQSVLLDIR